MVRTDTFMGDMKNMAWNVNSGYNLIITLQTQKHIYYENKVASSSVSDVDCYFIIKNY